MYLQGTKMEWIPNKKIQCMFHLFYAMSAEVLLFSVQISIIQQVDGYLQILPFS